MGVWLPGERNMHCYVLRHTIIQQHPHTGDVIARDTYTLTPGWAVPDKHSGVTLVEVVATTTGRIMGDDWRETMDWFDREVMVPRHQANNGRLGRDSEEGIEWVGEDA